MLSNISKRIILYTATVVVVFLILLPFLVGIVDEPPVQEKQFVPDESNLVRDKQYKPKNLPSFKPQTTTPQLPFRKEAKGRTPGRMYPHDSRQLFRPCMGMPVDAIPRSVGVGDVDGDGSNDIVVWLYYPDLGKDQDYLLLFHPNRERGLQYGAQYPITSGIENIAVGDVTGDSAAEIVAVDVLRKKLRIFSFDREKRLSWLDYDMSDIRRPKIADMNGDGRKDILLMKDISSNEFMTAVLYLGDSAMVQSIDENQYHTRFSSAETVKGTTMGDIDGDKRAELLVAYGIGYGSAVSVIDLMNPVERRTLKPPFHGPLYDNARFTPVGLIDINGDGVKDIVMYDHGIALYERKADGSFSDPVWDMRLKNVQEAVIRDGLAVGDVNDDGREDIIIVKRRTTGTKGDNRIMVLCRTEETVSDGAEKTSEPVASAEQGQGKAVYEDLAVSDIRDRPSDGLIRKEELYGSWYNHSSVNGTEIVAEMTLLLNGTFTTTAKLGSGKTLIYRGTWDIADSHISWKYRERNQRGPDTIERNKIVSVTADALVIEEKAGFNSTWRRKN